MKRYGVALLASPGAGRLFQGSQGQGRAAGRAGQIRPPPYASIGLWQASVGGDKPVMRLGLGVGTFGERVFAASPDGDVGAFDLKSGRALWRTKTKASLGGGTGAGASLVAVGSRDGEVLALDADDWR